MLIILNFELFILVIIMNKFKLYFFVFIASFLGAIAGGAIMVNAHGGDTSRIHACVGITASTAKVVMGGREIPPSTIVRIVGANDNCAANETPVDWSIQGPVGPGGFVTNMSGADLKNSDFRYRDFSGANVQGADFTYSNLQGVSFSNGNLSGTKFTSTNLKFANLSNTILTNTDFEGAFLDNANLSGADLSKTSIPFYCSSANSSNFSNVKLTGVTIQCSLNLADFTNADFTNARFVKASLWRATFTGAILTGVSFSNTICPDGTNSDNNGGTCIGHGM
jgi:hypothetical protein